MSFHSWFIVIVGVACFLISLRLSRRQDVDKPSRPVPVVWILGVIAVALMLALSPSGKSSKPSPKAVVTAAAPKARTGPAPAASPTAAPSLTSTRASKKARSEKRKKAKQRHEARIRVQKRRHQRLQHLRQHVLHFWRGYCRWWKMRHSACAKPRHAVRRVTSAVRLQRSAKFWRHRRNHVRANVRAWRKKQAAKRRAVTPVYPAPPPVLVATPSPPHRAAPVTRSAPPTPVVTPVPVVPRSSGGSVAPYSGGTSAPSSSSGGAVAHQKPRSRKPPPKIDTSG